MMVSDPRLPWPRAHPAPGATSMPHCRRSELVLHHMAVFHDQHHIVPTDRPDVGERVLGGPDEQDQRRPAGRAGASRGPENPPRQPADKLSHPLPATTRLAGQHCVSVPAKDALLGEVLVDPAAGRQVVASCLA